ncbi:aspartate aminotransferase family protein [cyanobiont of Ornithocercus magnificus]|nr:aspartate aminotransferase family protein [cyanobiont of Ornithocercus magnificus]
MGTYNRLPLTIIRGKGCWLWDDRGRRYLDAVAGIATCTLGHSNRALHRALSRQLGRLQHVSNLYRISEQEELASWLVANSCADSVFFCNSGAEANEAAIKLARKHAHCRGISKPIILSASSSFHGRTLAAVSATGQPRYHQGFAPLVSGFEFFPYNDFIAFERLVEQIERNGPRVAAVLVEPLQGEGGVNPGECAVFRCIRDQCDTRGILLILDEIQIGMGRSGQLWGYEHLGIEPDAFTLAKGLGGGHAIGALLVQKKADIFEPGDHASTFGGNPFACRAGLTVARELEHCDLLRNVRDRGNQLQRGLQQLVNAFPRQLEGTRGWGLLQGLVLRRNDNIDAMAIARAALEEKLLIASAGKQVVRLVPPLTISKREICQLLCRLQATLQRCF